MTRKSIGFLILLGLLLCACGAKDKYEPFTPLSKETVSPEREAAVAAAMNGDMLLPTRAVPTAIPEEPVVLPSFDEESFFAEVDPEVEQPKAIPTEPAPFEPEPTAKPTKAVPTATPMPTATKPYDPNIMMYGSISGMTTYTLQEGDDLVCLGRRFDVSLSQILSLNKLNSPDEAHTGDEIVLPRNPNPWSRLDGYGGRMLILHPALYTTQSGDTLFSIACRFGDVRPEDIAVRNQLVLGEPLKSGIQISIP